MTIANNLKTFLVALFSILFVGQIYADKTVEDLAGEDRVMYDKFRHLLVSGEPEEFYAFADEYANDYSEETAGSRSDFKLNLASYKNAIEYQIDNDCDDRSTY